MHGLGTCYIPTGLWSLQVTSQNLCFLSSSHLSFQDTPCLVPAPYSMGGGGAGARSPGWADQLCFPQAPALGGRKFTLWTVGQVLLASRPSSSLPAPIVTCLEGSWEAELLGAACGVSTHW